jgi:hypothetical protein
MFGEEEKIYSYKDQVINVCCLLKLFSHALQLRYTAGSLHQYLSISFSEKLPSTNVDDAEAKLSRFLPAGWSQVVSIYTILTSQVDGLRDEAAFKIQLAEDVLFKPPGQLIHSFERERDRLQQHISRLIGPKKGGIRTWSHNSADVLQVGH